MGPRCIREIRNPRAVCQRPERSEGATRPRGFLISRIHRGIHRLTYLYHGNASIASFQIHSHSRAAMAFASFYAPGAEKNTLVHAHEPLHRNDASKHCTLIKGQLYYRNARFSNQLAGKRGRLEDLLDEDDELFTKRKQRSTPPLPFPAELSRHRNTSAHPEETLKAQQFSAIPDSTARDTKYILPPSVEEASSGDYK